MLEIMNSALHTSCWITYLFLQYNAFQNNKTHNSPIEQLSNDIAT
jgi:hypothetical protein